MSRTWRNREELEHQVVTLHGQRVTRRGIARACGVSRNTVKKILIAHASQREQEHTALPVAVKRAPRPKKIDAWAQRVAQLMEKYEDITAQRVFEILREEGFDGGYTAVKTHVSEHRPKKKPKPSLTAPDYGPGEMAESDWSPYEVKLIDGSVLEVQAFDYALAHSGRKYYAFFRSNDLHALMDGHVQAFSRFGGCAKQCKYDGQKPVLIRWEGRQPIYNLRFVLFATHYEFRVASRAQGRPQAPCGAQLLGSSNSPFSTDAHSPTSPTCNGSSRIGSTPLRIRADVMAQHPLSASSKSGLVCFPCPVTTTTPRAWRTGCAASTALWNWGRAIGYAVPL